MLSVRLTAAMEHQLAAYCAANGVTKSHVVQEALAEWLVKAEPAAPESAALPDVSFLAPEDPLRAFIGIVADGPTTDELMRMTRGEDWNRP